jgi:uncharacterized membrane protein
MPRLRGSGLGSGVSDGSISTAKHQALDGTSVASQGWLVMKRLFALATSLALVGCVTPPPPPPPYHALGTEPFWNLLIDEHNLTFVQPDAQPITQPTPRVIIGIAGEIYQTPRINVNIVHGQCSDGMSDRVYPDKVQVTVDGRRFNGCGGL